jgi:hypothetical protein
LENVDGLAFDEMHDQKSKEKAQTRSGLAACSGLFTSATSSLLNAG